MYVVCAPDSFKGSMTARQAAAVMASGVREVLEAATTVELPIADGGEGFTDAVAAALGARLVATEVTDQRGPRPVAAFALATAPHGGGTAPRPGVLRVGRTPRAWRGCRPPNAGSSSPTPAGWGSWCWPHWTPGPNGW